MNVLMLYAHDLFDADLDQKSIAGTQTVFIQLSRALEQEGCIVHVHTQTMQHLRKGNRTWNHLDQVDNTTIYDLMIVNVSPHLLHRFKQIRARKKCFGFTTKPNTFFTGKDCVICCVTDRILFFRVIIIVQQCLSVFHLLVKK